MPALSPVFLHFYLNSICCKRQFRNLFARLPFQALCDVMYKRANAKFFIEIPRAWVETKGDKILSIPSCKEQIFLFCEWNNDSEETKRFKSLKRIISSCIPFFLLFFFFQIYIPFLLFSKTRSLLRVTASACVCFTFSFYSNPEKSWQKKNWGWKK